MKLTVKLDFGGGREIRVGTFSEVGRDTAFEFAGEFLSSGLNPAPFYDFTRAEGPNGWQTLSVAGEGANPGVDDLRRLAKEVGLETHESEAILERVVESCRSLFAGGF